MVSFKQKLLRKRGIFTDILEAENIRGFAGTDYYFQKTEGKMLSDRIHSHTFFEFVYVLSGACLHVKNGRRESLRPGDLSVILPGQSHCFLSQKARTDIMAMSVRAEEVRRFFALYGLCGFKDSSAFSLTAAKKEVFDEQCGRTAAIGEDAAHLRMLFNQMFLFCVQAGIAEKESLPSAFSAVLDRMQSLELCAEGVGAFGRISGYSHSQLCRLTKKYFGMTPTEYVNRLRMNHAYRLIVGTDADYAAICQTVGFESTSYFSKLVKETFGCSAARLRKKAKEPHKTV